MSIVSEESSESQFSSNSSFDDFTIWDCDLFEEEGNEKVHTAIVPLRRDNRKKKALKSSGKIINKVSAQQSSKESAAELKWLVFPSFDKSDSMLYFPSTFARLINCGDIPALAKLFKSYCMKDCSVLLNMDHNIEVSVNQFMELIDIGDVLYPDSFCCMHSTNVVSNQIQAVLYFKYTDTAEMHTFADSVVNDVSYKPYFVGERKQVMQRTLCLDAKAVSVQSEVYALLDAGTELQVYGCVNMVLTFDPHTKKITNFQHLTTYTSVSCDGVQYCL